MNRDVRTGWMIGLANKVKNTNGIPSADLRKRIDPEITADATVAATSDSQSGGRDEMDADNILDSIRLVDHEAIREALENPNRELGNAEALDAERFRYPGIEFATVERPRDE